MGEKPVDVIVKLMNEILALDQFAATALLAQTVPCNAALAAHPEVLIHTVKGPVSAAYTVDLLGVLNGIVARLEPDTKLVALFSDTQGLLGFARKLTEEQKVERNGQ